MWGALTFELLDRGISKAVIAEASAAYADAARSEAARRGRSNAVEIVHGDLMDVSESLAPATVVTLDRVVCCYPFYEPMLERAVRLAAHSVALSYPRDWWYVRGATWLENAKRARKSGFRTFVHPPLPMEQIIRNAGFELARRRTTAVWSIDIFVKPPEE